MNISNETPKYIRNNVSKSPKEQLDIISLAFMNTNNNKYSEIEMEARFGTIGKGIKSLTKIDYDNVVKKIMSSGWTTSFQSGLHLLRIQPEFLDVRTGQFKTSNNFLFDFKKSVVPSVDPPSITIYSISTFF